MKHRTKSVYPLRICELSSVTVYVGSRLVFFNTFLGTLLEGKRLLEEAVSKAFYTFLFLLQETDFDFFSVAVAKSRCLLYLIAQDSRIVRDKWRSRFIHSYVHVEISSVEVRRRAGNLSTIQLGFHENALANACLNF